MTLNDLKAFAKLDPASPFRVRQLTPEIAAAIVADHEASLAAEIAKVELFDTFDISGHVRRAEDKADVRKEFARRAVL